MIRLVIFDLDGTLVDSSVDITNALNHATGPYNIEKVSVEKTIGMVGEGVTRLIEKVLGEEKAGFRDDILERFIEYYSLHLSDFTAPYPGVRETLKELAGYKKAVISNKREALSRKLLEELNLSDYFDLIFGGGAGEKKPSPKPVRRVLELLAVSPEEAVMVGDSNYDIDAGRAAGVRTVAVSYGFRNAALLKDADLIIDDIRELPQKLREMNAGA